MCNCEKHFTTDGPIPDGTECGPTLTPVQQFSAENPDAMDKAIRGSQWLRDVLDGPDVSAGPIVIQKEERGVKHDFSKPQMSLLPLKDLEGVVRVLEFGMKKYARGDWKFVQDGAFRYFDAGMRHIGELTDPDTIEDLRKLDPESGMPHIDHAICSLIFARHFIFKEQPQEAPDVK